MVHLPASGTQVGGQVTETVNQTTQAVEQTVQGVVEDGQWKLVPIGGGEVVSLYSGDPLSEISVGEDGSHA